MRNMVYLPLLVVLLIFTVCNTTVPATTGGGTPSTQDKAPSKLGEAPAPSEIQLAHPEIPRIAAREVKFLLEKKADIVVVDTGSADSYDLWHIPTAVNMPYSPTDDPTNREMMLITLPVDKLIVIYCLCEEGYDSAAVALELRGLGYDHDKVKVLEGGLIRWDELGYPLIRQQTTQ